MNQSRSKLPIKRQRPSNSSINSGKTKTTRTTTAKSFGLLHRSNVSTITTAVPADLAQADVPLVSNPASQSKIDAIKDKEREVEETTKLKNMSADLLNYFRDLADNVKELAEDAQTEGKSLENWHRVFTMMGEMNDTEDIYNSRNKVWVRLKSNVVDKASR